VFAGDAHACLRDAGAAQVVTCNTIVHESNGIDVGGLIADGVSEMLAGPARRDSQR
jgi:ribose-phosphate pyrophosphokinase